MYYRFFLLRIILCSWVLLILVGCGGAEATIIPPLPTPATLTITFENHECTYSGPRPLSAGREISAYATIKDTDIPGSIPVVGITALTINQGYTLQDVEKDFRGTGGNIGIGVYVVVGSVEVMAGQSKPFSVRTTDLHGPIYFVCFIDPMSENFYPTGPIEVAGTTQ